MILRQLSLSVAIALAVLCVSRAQASDVSALISKLADLPNKSLALSATLNIVYFQTKTTVRYELEEMQSSWQKRSRIQYRAEQKQETWQAEAGIEESGTFMVDASQVLLLSTPKGAVRPMCKQVDRMEADKLFNLNSLDNYTGQLHLLGPARILSLLGENLDQVKSTPAPSDAAMRPIKNPVTFVYTYNGHTITAHYSGDPSNNLAHGVPLELVVSLGDLASQNVVLLFYDFTKIRLLEKTLNFGDGSQASKQMLGKSVAGPLMDMFAIDRAVGCSRASFSEAQESQSSGNREAPLKGLARMRYRFSFGSKPTLQGAESTQTLLKVVYEPSIDTLRVERANELHWVSTTTNYLTGLTYHAMSKRGHNENMQKIVPFMRDNDNDNDGDKDKKPGESAAPKWSCIVTKATTKAGEPATAGGGGLAGASSNPYSLGEMLLGLQPDKASQLRYLGMARVRGIDARAYELWGATWPVWFQAPLVYQESKNWVGVSSEAKYRASTGGMGCAKGMSDDREATVWNTVIYVSGVGNGGEHDLTAGNLLLIEMYELDTTTLRVWQRASFSIHDFAWHLTGASHSTDGARTEDFLSLGDTCLSRDDNQYGRLDMVLTLPANGGTPSELGAWLGASSRRNFAIMQAAQQQLALPASAIYDLESRLELDPSKQRTRIPVSFRTVERVRAVNQLVYMGLGNFKARGLDIMRMFAKLSVFHFQACYMMVAHRRMDTVFAYRPHDGRCYVFNEQVIGTVKQTVNMLFDMLDWNATTKADGTRATLEVYRVRHDGTPRSDTPPKSVLAQAEAQLGALSSVDLREDLSIDYDKGEELAVKTQLSSFKVHELDPKITPREQVDPTKTGEAPAAKFDTNKFEGLGLVATDAASMLIEAERQVSSSGAQDEDQYSKLVRVTNELTFGQCQTQCLLDLDCGSFSWCVREGRAECIHSKVNFKQAQLASQLIDLQSKRTTGKFGGIYTLEIKGSDQEVVGTCAQVQIRKHPTCELHNKHFMQLFSLSDPPKVRFDLVEMKLYPVGHRDDCAKLCLYRTLSALKKDVGPARQASLSGLMNMTAEFSEKSLKKLFQEHKEAHARICHAFSFYDRANFLALGDAKMNRLSRRVVATEATSTSGPADTNLASESIGGYCLLGDLQTDAKRKQMEREEATLAEHARRKKPGDSEDPNDRILASLEQFAFDFRFMFDRQYDVALRKTPVDADVETALAAAVRSQTAHISKHEFELLGEFVSSGDNDVHWMSQVLFGGGPANCARLCFLQQVPLWPGCKSFAHIERAALNSNQKISLCAFNTVSMRETLLRERFDLVRDYEAESRVRRQNNSDSQQQPPMIVWHYEPKPSFVSASLDWARAIETAASERLQTDDNERATGGGAQSIGGFGIFVCSLIGVSLGLFLGLKIGEQTLDASMSRAREDTEDLVNSIHGVEMAPGENGSQQRVTAGIEFSDLTTMSSAMSNQHEHDNDSTCELS